MSLKTKLISSISAICMVLALLCVGVWAVSTASVTLGGTVSFTADNIYAKVTGSITGTQESISLDELNYTADSAPSDSNIASWENNAMTFTSGNLITMTITVQNLSEERGLFVKLTDNTITNNIAKTLKKDNANYTSATEVEIAPKGTTTFTMTLSVSVLEKSASATVAYKVDLKDENGNASEDKIKLLHDTTNKYYYVEMGTYDSQPVRWKVSGVNGEHYEYNANKAPSGELTFILATMTTIHEFGYVNGDSANNDYATSAIRQYITGHDCATKDDGSDYAVSGNFLEDIGIDVETNEIYNKIIARDIKDLYKNINWDENTTISDGTTAATGEDKLWIPSVAEIYAIEGGGDLSTISASWDVSIDGKYCDYSSFWLRTPSQSSPFGQSRAVRIMYTSSEFGSWDISSLEYTIYVRPMFLLNV